MKHKLNEETVKRYKKHLILEERSQGTIEKYERDITAFLRFLPEKKLVEKEVVLAYKEYLQKTYAISTVNSMLAAINSLFSFLGWHDCRVKPYKQQRQIFRDKSKELKKEEYFRLLQAAKRKGNTRLFYIMQTIGSTGIRISELAYITVEAVEQGQAVVRSKGKLRTVMLGQKLRDTLCKYCQKQGIEAGPVFVTQSGKPMDRSNIWGEMKKLCADAKVDGAKVFPHNFRHLFAVTFYNLEKDIAKLADLLGHASIQTTRIYIMESGAEHEKQVNRLGLVI